MFGRIDYTGLYKFLASIGLTVIAISVIGPWVYLNSIQVLTLPAADLEQFTDIGQRSIQWRQALLGEYVWLVLLAAWGALGTGVSLLLAGLLEWGEQQKRSDESDRIDLAKKRASFYQAPPSEVSKLKEDEAREALPDPPPDSGSASGGSSSPDAELREARNSHVERARVAESQVLGLATEILGDAYQLTPNAKIAGRPYIIDAVFSPPEETSFAQLGLEVRLVSSSRMLRIVGSDTMNRVALATWPLAPGNVYTGNAGRPARARSTAVLVLVLPPADDREPGLDRELARLEQLVGFQNEIFKRPLGVLAISSQVLDEMRPAEFRRLLLAAWQSGSLQVAV